ncbi:uncharacterized protein DFL_004276 [Arthrobotrys flagrans]|uniref:Extracellular membrane protein CFEM domain-containing protein n=1 Tax=Arthrobotrys flagrans TaxID=97331 RepID=A0A437A4B0_ARTFL|nr:hypothetical protein DFL_004276 [Arthrobotrys flagrans]
MRSIALVLPTFLLLLTTELVLAKFNWGRPWDNSKLGGWEVYVEASGSWTGFYQLSCQSAKDRVQKGELGGTKSSSKDALQAIKECETSCRCNMFGEFLLNPLASEVCNNDSFLKKCIGSDRDALACICTWSQGVEGQIIKWKQQPNNNPGEKGDAPPVFASPPHEDTESPSGGFPWYDDKDFKL